MQSANSIGDEARSDGSSRLKLFSKVKKFMETLPNHLQSLNLNEIVDSLIIKEEFKVFSREMVVSVVEQMIADKKATSFTSAVPAAATPSKRSRPIDDSSNSKKDSKEGQPIESSKKSRTSALSSGHNGSSEKRIANKSAGSSSKTINAVNSYLSVKPSMRFSNLAGMNAVIAQIQELVCYPLQYQSLYTQLGVCPPCGILFHGPSGCGKTALANAIAGETGLGFFKVSGPELVGGTSGESEENIRKVFDSALSAAPSILFIDAFEVLAAKRDSNQRGMDRRIVAQLLDCIDTLIDATKSFYQQPNNDEQAMNTNAAIVTDSEDSAASKANLNDKKGHVILIVATNKPEQLDPSVRGRFAREIALPVPDAKARSSILRLQASGMTLAGDVDFDTLGRLTPGFVGSDLQVLARQAGLLAVSRIITRDQDQQQQQDAINEQNLLETVSTAMAIDEEIPLPPAEQTRSVEQNDFLQAIKTVQPTAKREGFAIAPDVTWNDVGALTEVREELKHNVLEPIAHPERFRALGLEVPAGVLFYGPPGCGKTLLAKALANQSGANFISVKGPELLNMFVGESESRVRQVFARARASAPCVIFFDELDALCPRRSSGWDGSGNAGGGGGNGVSERVVNQLLTELDGLESRKDVYIIAATNRLELIDEAMLRPGRLGNLLYVPLPTAADRVSILTALTRKVSLNIDYEDHGVDLSAVALDTRCEGFSGADLSALVREAGLAVIKEISASYDMNMMIGVVASEEPEKITKIGRRHFEAALSKVKPSLTPQDRLRYDRVRGYLKQGLSAIEALRQGYDDIYNK